MSGRTVCGIAIAVFLLAVPGAPLADDAEVSGTATYRERIALPPDAVFIAVLADVSRADAPAVEIGWMSREENLKS
jgi:putative lipoprotein